MENLGIDIKLLIAQAINFALFFIIFKKFIAKPFSTFLNLEVEKEKEKEKILGDLRKKEEDMILEEKKVKERIKKEYDAAVKSAREEAAKLKEALVIEAKKEASDVVSKGKTQLGEEREAMNREIKKKVADLSVMMVNKALKQFLTEDVQKIINKHILKNFSKDLS